MRVIKAVRISTRASLSSLVDELDTELDDDSVAFSLSFHVSSDCSDRMTDDCSDKKLRKLQNWTATASLTEILISSASNTSVSITIAFHLNNALAHSIMARRFFGSSDDRADIISSCKAASYRF